MSNAHAIDLGLDWITNSNIRYMNSDGWASGGVKNGYNWQQQYYPFIYSEITGYAISFLANAFRWTGKKNYLVMAKESADYIMKIQLQAKTTSSSGAILHSLTIPELEPRYQYYSFDAAMCLQGLLDLEAIQNSSAICSSAQDIGDWLIKHMQLPNGAFLAMYNADTEEWKHLELFGDNGCLHAKLAVGLLKLANVTKTDHYRTAAMHVCDWVLTLQQADGAFRATETEQQVLSHTHCYATEGLLFAHYWLGDQRYLDAARRAGEWLLEVQHRDGSLNIAYNRRLWRMGRRAIEKILPQRVSDSTAQAIRIWLTLYYLEGDKRFLEACYRARDFLLSMQIISSEDPNARGGFYFSPKHPIIFAWPTMFAIHALYALANVDRKNGYEQIMTELF